MGAHVVTLNSSSIKFAVSESRVACPKLVAAGEIEQIPDHPILKFRVAGAEVSEQPRASTSPISRAQAIGLALRRIEDAYSEVVIAAIGHRVVDGAAKYSAPPNPTWEFRMICECWRPRPASPNDAIDYLCAVSAWKSAPWRWPSTLRRSRLYGRDRRELKPNSRGGTCRNGVAEHRPQPNRERTSRADNRCGSLATAGICPEN